MKTICPHCKQVFPDLPAEYNGVMLECTVCHQSFIAADIEAVIELAGNPSNPSGYPVKNKRKTLIIALSVILPVCLAAVCLFLFSGKSDQDKEDAEVNVAETVKEVAKTEKEPLPVKKVIPEKAALPRKTFDDTQLCRELINAVAALQNDLVDRDLNINLLKKYMEKYKVELEELANRRENREDVAYEEKDLVRKIGVEARLEESQIRGNNAQKFLDTVNDILKKAGRDVLDKSSVDDFKNLAIYSNGDAFSTLDLLGIRQALAAAKSVDGFYSTLKNADISIEKKEDILNKYFGGNWRIKLIYLQAIQNYDKKNSDKNLFVPENKRVLRDLWIFPKDDDNPFFFMKDNCLVNRKENKLLYVIPNSTGEYNIPQGVKVLDDSAFIDCENNMVSVTLPEGVTDIGCAFAHARKLKDITLPDSVTVIKNDAFKDSGCADTVLKKYGSRMKISPAEQAKKVAERKAENARKAEADKIRRYNNSALKKYVDISNEHKMIRKRYAENKKIITSLQRDEQLIGKLSPEKVKELTAARRLNKELKRKSELLTKKLPLAKNEVIAEWRAARNGKGESSQAAVLRKFDSDRKLWEKLQDKHSNGVSFSESDAEEYEILKDKDFSDKARAALIAGNDGDFSKVLNMTWQDIEKREAAERQRKITMDNLGLKKVNFNKKTGRYKSDENSSGNRDNRDNRGNGGGPITLENLRSKIILYNPKTKKYEAY